MKLGWQIKSLNDICNVVNGGTPKTNVKEYWEGKHLWVTPAEMGKRLSPYIDETERKLTDLGLCNCSAQMVPPYSVILSTRAPIGHLVINTEPMSTNQGCKSLVPGSEVHYKYLYYYLRSIVALLNSLGTGTTFKELSGGKLKEVTIPVPPLTEQQRIVGILDKAFEGIDATKANAKNNLCSARALFDGRLADVFSNKKNGGWITMELKKVCEKIVDGTHQTPTYFESGYIFLSSRNVTRRKIDWEKIKFIDKKQHLEMHKRVAPRLNDILLAKNGTTGVAAIVDRDVEFDIYVSLALLRPLKIINPSFLLYFINSPVAKKQFNKRLKGIGVPNLHLEEIREVIISYPELLSEQEQIVAKLDDLHAETQRLELIYQQKIDMLEALKLSLLHQAFTGNL